MSNNMEKGILKDIFNSRLEKISSAIESEEMSNEDFNREELMEKLTELTTDEVHEIMKQIQDNNNFINSMVNEKYYKIGFKDAINLIFECLVK